jgi:hypothetical protein
VIAAVTHALVGNPDDASRSAAFWHRWLCEPTFSILDGSEPLTIDHAADESTEPAAAAFPG